MNAESVPYVCYVCAYPGNICVILTTYLGTRRYIIKVIDIGLFVP